MSLEKLEIIPKLAKLPIEFGKIGDCLQTQQLLFGKLETISNPAKLLRKFGEIDCGYWKLLPKLPGPNYCVNRVWRNGNYLQTLQSCHYM